MERDHQKTIARLVGYLLGFCIVGLIFGVVRRSLLHFFVIILLPLLLIVVALVLVIALTQVFGGSRAISLLVLRYLRKRRIAWVSLIAVTLCTMMVLVVISVMGGWLRMFRETNHGLIGDLIISRNALTGFTHYQDMIDGIKALPEVKAAAPEIHTYGLINIKNDIGFAVEVVGLDPQKMQPVNNFVAGLHLQPKELEAKAAEYDAQAAKLEKDLTTLPPGDTFDLEIKKADAHQLRDDAQALRKKARTFPSFDLPLSPETYRQQPFKGTIDEATLPGMIVGSGVIGLEKDDKGDIQRPEIMYRALVKLTPLVLNEDVSSPEKSFTSSLYWIVDDSRTQVYQVDQKTVYVPFDSLQKDMKMDSEPYINKYTGKEQNTDASCNDIEISLKDPSQINQVKPEIEKIVDQVTQKYGMAYLMDPIKTQTWEERQADFLNAVEHEEGLLVILFAIISVVAVFLIFCIFFMIVMEKTRDVGILKSVGATSTSIAAIFLSYGLAIGIVGGGLGLLLGWLIIHNINELHTWLGNTFHVKIWDAKTYLFDTIPNTMDPKDVIIIVSIAVLASVLGALVPAIRAARMNPVQALRWE